MTIPFMRCARHAALACVALAVLTACSRRADKAVASDSTAMAPAADAAAMPSPGAPLDCTRASGDIEKLVCSDPKLSALDQKLGSVYREAEAKQVTPPPAWFTAEQQAWIKGRDDCWKSTDQRACADSAYTLRIAAIQATSLLVPTKGPVVYVCPRADGSHDEVQAMYADTDPPSVVLARGEKSVVAYIARSGSGAKYAGANVTFWDKGGEVQVTWFGTNLTCREQAGSS